MYKEFIDDASMTYEDWANDVIDHFTEITGRPVKDVYYTLYVPDDTDVVNEPMFDDSVVEDTYNAIRDYLLAKGLRGGEVDEVWYALDDALTARREELDACDVADNTDDYIQGASKMPELAATAERIADEIADFLEATTRISNLDDYLDDEDMGALGKSCDALNDFAQSYSYDNGYR